MVALSDPTDDLPPLDLLPDVAPAEGPKMRCPYCGAEHEPDRQGRFCDGCGLSIAPPPKLTLAGRKPKRGEALQQTLCAMCGAQLRGGKCPSCG